MIIKSRVIQLIWKRSKFIRKEYIVQLSQVISKRYKQILREVRYKSFYLFRKGDANEVKIRRVERWRWSLSKLW